MRSGKAMLACGLVVIGLLLSGETAWAGGGGGGGSAGNSQYVDPLSAQGHSGHHKTKANSTGASTTTSTTSSSSTLSQSAPSSVSSSSGSTSSSSGSTSSSHSSSGKTLPFTGLNLWACIGLGLGLLGTGLALRRALARAY